jgi:flagellar assembly protein FliH
MKKASPFLFERDFRDPSGASDAKHTAEMHAAEQRGLARGTAEGRRAAEADHGARLAAALDSLAAAAEQLLSGADRHRAEVEADAVAFALALGRKLAGEALEAQPLAPIAEAASAAFQHLRGVPHLVVRVNDALVEPVAKLVRQLAADRGFEGRLVVLGEPDIAPSDVRLEWADGGLVREQSRIDDAVLKLMSAAGPAPDATRSSPSHGQ